MIKTKLMTRKDVKRVTKSYGATIEVLDGGRYLNWCLDAPKGKTWACDNLHALVYSFRPGEDRGEWEDKESRDAIERMNYGLMDCTDPDCDSCCDEDEI